MNLFVFGMGYSATASVLAMREAFGPFPVAGTTRAPDKLEAIAAIGATPVLFDGQQGPSGLAAGLASATHCIQSIAPTEAGDPVLEHARVALDAARDLEWLCYYSTVGVYGDFGGAWIDEDAPCHPQNRRSRWRLAAEDAWRAYADERGLPLAILRLAGIYGPGRSTFDKLRRGTSRRIAKKGQVFNRIHVADIARVTALAAREKLEGTFNLADDEPAPPQDVIVHAAEMSGLPLPPAEPFETAEMTSMARSFYSDNKRVSNARIKQALGIELLYPTYREGLAAISAWQGL